MPNIIVKLPKGSFTADAKAALAKGITDAAIAAEKLPDRPESRFLCWVTLEDVEPSQFFCGGVDVTAVAVPLIVQLFVPRGVLNGSDRADYVEMIHAACMNALKTEERKIFTSIIIHEVEEGMWGANGSIWRLPDFARAAGYVHLQDLLPSF
jgi:phenylpyruvate tautomerase PptA (4-oxalocrotonate tautomerase family)